MSSTASDRQAQWNAPLFVAAPARGQQFAREAPQVRLDGAHLDQLARPGRAPAGKLMVLPCRFRPGPLVRVFGAAALHQHFVDVARPGWR